jgi:putative NADPH-quinone reductase
MPRNVLIVIGHPVPSSNRLCRALANAYFESAEQAGHAVRQINLATLDFPLLRTLDEFERGRVPDGLKDAAATVARPSI